jgi:hypothetical protein
MRPKIQGEHFFVVADSPLVCDLSLPSSPSPLCPLLAVLETRRALLMAAAATNLAGSKRAMAHALCKHLNVDPVRNL